ncbi:MAG: UvrD-helicase domain-containing protein, partial [Thermodesulfobacteriota bacterium]
MPFLKELNPTQKEAVTFGDGPLLILAGAGSGKTKVLTTRVAHLVLKRDVRPESVLAVTFTNKAAGEIRERLTALMGERARRLWLGTFHSIGLRILRSEGRRTGVGPELTVYNTDDQIALVKLAMEELKISDKAFSPRAMLSRIDRAKNENIGPDEYLADAGDFLSDRVARVYTLYQKKLREMGAMDFGDLICEPIRLLNSDPDMLARYCSRFRHILVDEYQDTNRAQYLLMNLLAEGHGNLCAVGDPDQSIYGWRGADVQNILDFERDWTNATVVRLEQNYRSTKSILAAANSVIKNNRGRMEKTLWTENPEGPPASYRECRDEHREAETVTARVRETLVEEPSLGYGDFAVFYRTNAQSRVFEEKFLREGIPYTIVGGVRFYDRKEIRDALAFLRVVANPGDSMGLKRIINTPPRGIGKVTVERVSKLAAEKSISLFEAFGEAIKTGIVKNARAEKLFEAFERTRENLEKSEGVPLHELALGLLIDNGYIEHLEVQRTDEAMDRLENVHEFISAIKEFESAPSPSSEEGGGGGSTLSEFLDRVSLISDVDTWEDKKNSVTLMTLHSAKGLEFPVVFMV